MVTQSIESGQAVELIGKSGATYQGRIYSDKQSSSELPSPAIVCLSNSSLNDGQWKHQIRDIYDTKTIEQALDHFRERDDISHMILIPGTSYDGTDRINDLRRAYIHG
jgi:hypothetical protein